MTFNVYAYRSGGRAAKVQPPCEGCARAARRPRLPQPPPSEAADAAAGGSGDGLGQ
jgi:hypothetical protein